MVVRPADSAARLPLLESADSRQRTRSAPLERELTELFEELRRPLFRYLLSFGLSVQDGEEVTQEVFLALFQHLRQGKPRENLRGWIFRVGHNLALKRRGREMAAVRARTDGERPDERLDPSPNPEEQAADSQRRRRLMAVVRALPEQDRHCLNLRAEGLRYREIAETLGMSLGAVSVSLAQSLGRLSRIDER
jgi:RNA polymerase sigma-70 factor (ECF subfamily)